jgi:hypothetical protein
MTYGYPSDVPAGSNLDGSGSEERERILVAAEAVYW